MKYACEDQRFKDAVNQYFYKQLERNMSAGETVHDMDANYCDRVSSLIIYKEWRKCMTENDIDEIETHCTDEEYSNINEFLHEELKFFNEQVSDQLSIEIQKYINNER